MLATYLHSTTLRTRNYISTAGLREPSQSLGQHLYVHGTDGDYLSVMGIDRDTFKHLFDHFSDFYVVSSGPGRSGRPPKLSSKGTVLACLLHFYAGTMSSKLSLSSSVYPPQRSPGYCTMLRLPSRNVCGLYRKPRSPGQVLLSSMSGPRGWRGRNRCSKAGGGSLMERTIECRSQQMPTCRMQCTTVILPSIRFGRVMLDRLLMLPFIDRMAP
jgi:hypothetical protein